MQASYFLMAKALVSLAFGLAYLLVPVTSAAWFGMSIGPEGALITQMLGATLVGIGLVCWFTSQATRTGLARDVMVSLFVADSIGFVVTLRGQLALQLGAMGWLGVLIWLLLALGLGYFGFVQ